MIRLCAAASVVFSHYFTIVDGHEDNEPFKRLIGEIIGTYGVFVFLILSGYLDGSKNLANPGISCCT